MSIKIVDLTISKLPKWAQNLIKEKDNEINLLKRQLQEHKETITSITKENNVANSLVSFTSNHMDISEEKYLPEDSRFTFSFSSKERYKNHMIVYLEDAFMYGPEGKASSQKVLKIYGSYSFAVYPQSSNCIYLQLLK